MASKFYLMNEKKERYDLNTIETGVFTEPSGFGIEYNNTYLSVGDRWVKDSTELKQPEFAGKIVFAKNNYLTFNRFVDFITAAKGLIFVYQPIGLTEEYFSEIDVIQIDKGGFHKAALTIPVKFRCKSLLYTEEKFEFHIEKADDELRFDFKWDTRFNDMNNVYFTYENTGHVESPFMLTFTGKCSNPTISVMQNDVEVYSMSMNVTLEATERLALSTFDDDLYIEINGVDRKDILDFTKLNFFKFPQGKSQIFFSCSSGNVNNITLTLEKYYKGV